MALAGELAKYVGNEMIKTGGKELAKAGAKSALSSIAPKVATKLAKSIGNEFIASSMLDNLLPASRMLDKSGKPVTLYHSTPNKFTEFSDEMLGSNTGYDNTSLGHFVTPDKDFSKRFIDINNKGLKGQTMELQANIRNPILHPYMAGSKYKDPALRDKIVENYFLATDNQEGLNTLRDMVAEDALEFGNDANLYNEYMALADDPGGVGPFEFAGDERDLLKKKGYDAVEIVEGPKSGLVEGSKDNSPVSSYAVFDGKNLRPVRHIPVNSEKSVLQSLNVNRGNEIPLYRGIHADSPANLQKYIAEMKDPNIVPRTYTGNAFAGDGYHFYDNIEGAREYARDGVNLGEPYGAVVKIDVPKNRFIGINSQNGNDAESFIGRALERGAENAPEVGSKDFRNYIQRNGILGSHNTGPFRDNSQYVVMNNDATAGLEAIENYENGQLMEDIVNSGADKYLPKAPTQIKFNKDLSIRKTGGNFGHKGVKGMRGGSAPKVQQSKNGESLTDIANRIKAMNKSGEMSSNIKRIGSSGVAKIDKDTLPAGYDIVKKYLGKSPADITKEIEDIIGVALDDPSAGDKLAKFVEDEGYDVSKNIIDNLNTARQILDERTINELNMEGAQKYAQFIQTRGALAKDNPSRGVGPRTFTISADDDVLSQTDAAKLDKEYSDRLGIGRSHTPMNDKTLSSDAKGYYMGGGIGINPLHARGETGVSTIAHERMHAWQDINSGSWDSRVGEAIDELRNELKKFYHTKDQIKAYRKSGYDLDYYANDKEQEARMLQSYLDNEGFTDTYHKNDSRGVEWGDEIKPAFDKFYNKLRKLSKAGVALPAIALLFGLNTNSEDKSVDNIK